MRLTWLADALRAAGCTVVEVDGWKTRGSDEFDPVGVTWHATAGSRKATAQGEVNVILHGSTSAPPPIAQLMIWRDGTVYVCAAGRCNHNKVGWAGPNKGLGNTRLFGIEMANDNSGEPWPEVQLDAARRATAAVMRRLRADPMKRLAGHYEHQPYKGRPAGETSTKSDPLGVDMAAERKRVADIGVRKMVMEDLDGYTLPVLYQGYDDAHTSGWNWVGRAQTLLTWLGHYAGQADGVYGPKTAAAVKALGFGEGRTIDRPAWAKLYGLTRATTP